MLYFSVFMAILRQQAKPPQRMDILIRAVITASVLIELLLYNKDLIVTD